MRKSNKGRGLSCPSPSTGLSVNGDCAKQEFNLLLVGLLEEDSADSAETKP